MPRATYVRTDDKGVKITSCDGVIIRSGVPWPYENWSLTPDALEALRSENPDMEFVEVGPDSK